MARDTATATELAAYPWPYVTHCRYLGSDSHHVEPGHIINPSTGLPFGEAASSVFKAGDMVYLDAGAVTLRNYNDTGPILGFALQDASGVTGAPVKVMPVVAGVDYVMNWYSSAIADTSLANAGAIIGKACGITGVTWTRANGTIVYSAAVNPADTTYTRVIVKGVYRAAGLTSTARCLPLIVRFMPVIVGATAYQGLQYDA